MERPKALHPLHYAGQRATRLFMTHGAAEPVEEPVAVTMMPKISTAEPEFVLLSRQPVVALVSVSVV